jgi:hypothetical protein
MTRTRPIEEHIHWKRNGLTLRASVHRVRAAHGPWVVFAHGFTGHRLGPDYLFVTLARALAHAGVSSLRFDFTGSGESDGRFCDMTLSTMEADLLSAIKIVRREYSPRSVVLLGHSLGGAVCALVALRAKAAGLALFAPVGDPAGILARRKDTVIAAGLNARGFYENGPHEMSLAFVDDLKSKNPVVALDGYTGPLIVFQGECDASITPQESGRYTAWAQSSGVNAQYHLVKGNDHNFLTVAGTDFLCSTLCSWMKERAR